MNIMHNPLHPGEIVRDALFNETELHTIEEAARKLKV
jgi:plasmid maintenance system antidote protein VapI